MKKFIALALVTLGFSVSARAQRIVFDPNHERSVDPEHRTGGRQVR
jgi:hypothetical protein